jgi:CubicO group peptidase (beta-lactamase class C family)
MIKHLLKLPLPELIRNWVPRLLVTLILFVWLVPMSNASHPSLADLDVAAIDAFVQTQMDRHRIQGLALAITQGDEVLHLQGYGTAGEGRPVEAHTPFYLGSVTKSFTALAVMQLVDTGQIELNRPIQDYLPWFEVADPGASAKITVRHLLNQTSGLSRASYAGALQANASMEDLVHDLSSARPTEPVGAEFQYFNPNYTTLGLLVETVSGQSYGEYMADHVFAPLQMERSFTSRAAAEEAGLAQGYNVLFGFPVPRAQPHLSYDLPAGFIISTAEDMAHYLIAQLNGGRYKDRLLISPEGLAQMHRPPGDVDNNYAMGWEVREQEDVHLLQHDGTLETFYASAVLLPDTDYGVALLANQVSYPHMLFAYEDIVQGIADHLLGREAEPSTSTTTVYLLFSAIAIVTLLFQIRSLLRLHRWRGQIRDRGLARTVLDILWKLILGVFVLLILPWLLIRNAGLAATRVSLLNYLPDVTLWLGLMAALSLTEAMLKAWHLVQMKREKRNEYA